MAKFIAIKDRENAAGCVQLDEFLTATHLAAICLPDWMPGYLSDDMSVSGLTTALLNHDSSGGNIDLPARTSIFGRQPNDPQRSTGICLFANLAEDIFGIPCLLRIFPAGRIGDP